MDELCGLADDFSFANVQEEVMDDAQDSNVAPQLELSFSLSHLEMQALTSKLTRVEPSDPEECETVTLANQLADGDFVGVLSSKAARFLFDGHSFQETRQRIVEFLDQEPTSYSTASLRAYQVVLVGAAALQLYVQTNYTGPTIKPEEFARAVSFDASFEGLSAEERQDSVREALQCDGEWVVFNSKNCEFLLASRLIFSILQDGLRESTTEETAAAQTNATGLAGLMASMHKKFSPFAAAAFQNVVTLSWWQMRSIGVLQESIEIVDAAPSLVNELGRIHPALEKRVVDLQLGADEVARFWLESGLCNHKLKQVKQAKVCFQNAKDTVNLTIELTGALGKRTKFQSEDKSQLVILASSSSTKEAIAKEDQDVAGTPEDESLPVDAANPAAATSVKIQTVKLTDVDEHTPLRETIKFSDADKDSKMRVGQLSVLDEAILLAFCIDVRESYAMEQLTAEEMTAYVQRVMQHQQNWQVFSTALFLKSSLEYERYKTKERAVLQMQVLVDQQSSRLTPLQARTQQIEDSAPASERLEWIHAVAWPSLWLLKRGLADRYLKLGVAGSALEIYSELHIWERAVECLVMMDKRNKAEKLIHERLEVAPSANLMCILGDMKQDPSWFEKAWEFSGQRHSRSMRLLGGFQFNKGDIQGCMESLQKALAINPLFPGTWFRLGVCSLRVGDYKLAKKAFVQVISQEPSDGDSWANLCAVHSRLGDDESALVAIAEAVKHSRHNWKIWENYVTLAVKAEEWGMAIEGMNRLLDLSVGIGQRATKSRSLDHQALLFVADKMMSPANIARPATLQGEVVTSDHWEVYVKNLVASFEELLKRVEAECQSDANTWKILSIYYNGTGKYARAADFLAKRCRSVQTGTWEREQDQVERVCKVTEDFATYSLLVLEKHSDQVPSSLKQDVKMQVKMVLSRCEPLFAANDVVKGLRGLYTEQFQ